MNSISLGDQPAWRRSTFRTFLVTSRIKYYYDRYSTKAKPYEYVSTRGLLEIIHKVTGWDIKIFEVEKSVEWEVKHFKGQLLRYENEKRAVLLIPALKEAENDRLGVSRCERRFAVVKEICHLIIDDPGVEVSDITSLVNSIVVNGQSMILVGVDDPILIQEHLAELAALELLLWSEYRQGYLQKINDGELTTMEIAQRFSIPESKVITLVNQNGFIETCREDYYDNLELLEGYYVQAMPADIDVENDNSW